MLDWLNPTSPESPSTQIADAIRSQVGTGGLPAGTDLPSTRTAAAELGVHRHTVSKAYRDLCRAGVLERTPGGRFRVPRTVPAAAPPEEVERFAAECLRRATELRIAPDALVEALSSAATERPARVTLVECSADQCEDLRDQLQAGWVVDVTTFDLGAAAADEEPPPGPLLTTLAHVTDVSERWPERARDAHFLTAAVCPSLGPVLAHLAGAAGSQDAAGEVRLLVDWDLVGGRTLAEALATLSGVSLDRFHVAAVTEEEEDPARAASAVIATPHAYRRLSGETRSSPRTVRIRYAFDPQELEALAAARGWKKRQLRAVAPLTHSRHDASATS